MPGTYLLPIPMLCASLTAHRIELSTPCADGRDLLSCPDFSNEQPYGPATMPVDGRWAPDGECPRCDYKVYDMRRRRVIVIKRKGLRLGTGAAKGTVGVECTCCRVM